jgi:hypothetical protein
MKGLEGHSRRNAYILVAIAIALVIIPLGTTTLRIFQQRLMAKEAVQLTHQWIADTDYRIKQIKVVGDQINLEIHGSGERPVLSDLSDQLNESLGQPVNLHLVIVPAEQESYLIE